MQVRIKKKKKKVLLKRMVFRGGYKKMFSRGGCDPQNDYE